MDGTLAALRKIRDSRLQVMPVARCGVAKAANWGTRFSRSQFIARMDADDFACPTRLEKQLHLLKTQDLDVVGCEIRILDHLGQPVESLRRYEHWINEEANTHDRILAFRFVELPLVNPTILARRGYFEIGFRESQFPEDYDLMLRAAARGLRFGKVKEMLYEWSDHPRRLTRTDQRYSREAFMKCRRSHLLDGPLRDVAVVDFWGVGKAGKPWLTWLQRNKIAVRHAYDVDERKIGNWIHGVKISHPISMPTADDTLLVIAVGSEHSRQTILPQLELRGYVAGRDAWFVA